MKRGLERRPLSRYLRDAASSLAYCHVACCAAARDLYKFRISFLGFDYSIPSLCGGPILYFLTLQPQCKNDHPSQMLHLRQNSWKQVGSLSRPSASRIYRRVGIISACSLTRIFDAIAQCIRYTGEDRGITH